MANHIFIPSTLKTTASEELEKEILKDLSVPESTKSIAQLIEDQNEKEESTRQNIQIKEEDPS
jgi:hypothetical protein